MSRSVNSLNYQPLNCLVRHAEHQPDALAVGFLQDGEGEVASWTYGELARHAHALAMRLQDRVGYRVLLLHPPGLEFVAALYGCWLAGAVAVPAPLPKYNRNNRSGERFARLVADAEPVLALTTRAKLHQAKTLCASTPGLEHLVWLASDDSGTDGAGEWQLPSLPDAEQLALLQYTSGSTGSPRGVMLSHGNLASNQAAIQAKFGHTQASRVVSWLPPYHDMGLIGGILQPLTVGCPVLLMDPAHFIQRPSRWLRAISRFGATTSGGPDFAYQLCLNAIGEDELDGVDLSAWDLAFTGAEPVRADTLRRFGDRFAAFGFRRTAFYPCYGLAEATLLATGGDKAREPVLQEIGGASQVGCGSAAAGHALLVVGPEGRPCGEGEVGEIWLSGPGVARGYWRQPEETAATFEARLAGTSSGDVFLRTGDLGCLRDGELFVMGRLKDLIILRGRNVYPQDIEALASACHPAIGASAAFGIPSDQGEQLVVVAEIRREQRHAPHLDRALATLHAVIAREFDLRVAQAALVNPGTLPRTTSGKIRRGACREAYLAGDWTLRARLSPDAGDAHDAPPLAAILAAAMAAPTADDRLAGLRRYLERRTAQVLGVPVGWLTPEATLAELGVDSLMRVELLLQLEADLGIPLGAGAIHAEASLNDLARWIHAIRESAGKAPPPGVPSAEDVPEGTPIPFTPIQAEFLRPGLEAPLKLHTIAYLRIPAGTDMARLEAAALGLDAEFDALRARFVREGEYWTQSLAAAGTGVRFRRIDLVNASASEVRDTGDRLYQTMHEGFDLACGPLAQAVWLDRGEGKSSVMLFGVHHLVADGTAMAVLLVALERAYRRGVPPGLTFHATRYAQWGHRLAAFGRSPAVLADLAYWRQVCGQKGEGPASPSPEGPDDWAAVRRTMDPLRQQRLLERYPSSRAQHDFFLALWALTWGQHAEQARVLVQLESHGRHPLGDGVDPDAPITTVGWLASRYPVAVTLVADEPLLGLIDRVTHSMAGIPHHGLSYGLLRYSHPEASVRAEMGALAWPEIGLVYRSRLDHGFRADALFPVIAIQHMNQSRPVEHERPGMVLEVSRGNAGLTWRISYNKRWHAEATVRALADHLQNMLHLACPLE